MGDEFSQIMVSWQGKVKKNLIPQCEGRRARKRTHYDAFMYYDD